MLALSNDKNNNNNNDYSSPSGDNDSPIRNNCQQQSSPYSARTVRLLQQQQRENRDNEAEEDANNSAASDVDTERNPNSESSYCCSLGCLDLFDRDEREVQRGLFLRLPSKAQQRKFLHNNCIDSVTKEWCFFGSPCCCRFLVKSLSTSSYTLSHVRKEVENGENGATLGGSTHLARDSWRLCVEASSSG